MEIKRIFGPLLVTHPGAEVAPTSLKSHVLVPIPTDDGLPHGYSRRWGHVSRDTQGWACARVCDGLRAERFPPADVGYALALIRCESGLNPDAAASSSSACGLAQLIDATRRAVANRIGLPEPNAFEVGHQVVLLAECLREAFAFVRRRHANADRYLMAYAYHHDGPSLRHGGVEVARAAVLPFIRRGQEAVERYA